jgi:hypothetical protein
VYRAKGKELYFIVKSARNTLDYEIGYAIILESLQKLIDDGFEVDLVGRPD